MEIQLQNGTLSVRGLRDLSFANANEVRDLVSEELAPDLKRIEIDLSGIDLVDSSGVGALVSVYQIANSINLNGGVTLHLLHPQLPVQQMFELTRLHHLFEIVPAGSSPK